MLNNYPKDTQKTLEEDSNEVKKTICEKSGTINKKIENLKEKSLKWKL